jgi:broad specificity phosphatase PhoE
MASQTEAYTQLAARLPRPAQVICTPLSRTRLTLEALIRAGYPEQVPQVDAAFVEQNFGDLQGVPVQQFEVLGEGERHPFWPIHAAETPPGGESFEHLITRVGAGLEALLRHPTGTHTIIVSHGGAIRAACAHALGLTPHQALCLQIDNISLTRLEYSRRGWRVLSINEHSAPPHLPDPVFNPASQGARS